MEIRFNPKLFVVVASVGPIITFLISYIIALSTKHMHWNDDEGIPLSGAIAKSPERFVGTFGLSISCIGLFVVFSLRKVYCDLVLRNSFYFIAEIQCSYRPPTFLHTQISLTIFET